MQLNEEQTGVVNSPITLKTCIRIPAGAGSGKTTTSCHRVKHWMEHHRISKNRILMTTFSNRAARDMRKKLKLVTGKALKDLPLVSTFHSFCLDILKEESDSEFVVLSDWENKMVFREALEKHFDIAHYPKSVTTTATNSILEALSEMYSTYNINKWMKVLDEDLFNNTDEALKGQQLVVTYRDMYEIVNSANSYKTTHDLVSFDDIIYNTFELLKSNEEAMCRIRKKYIYTIFDECQDLSALQFMMIYNVFNTGHTNLVYDLEQEIYQFRFSDGRYLAEDNLFKAYNEVITYPLSYNFRSAHSIVKLGNILREFAKSDIIQIPAEHNKHLENKVLIKQVRNNISEGKYVGEHIKSLIKDGAKYKDIAVITRTNRYIKTVLEPVLMEQGIPYIISGSKAKKLSDKSEVLFIINCLQLLVATPGACKHIAKQILPNLKKVGPAGEQTLRGILEGGYIGFVDKVPSKYNEVVELFKSVREWSLERLEVASIGDYIDLFLSCSKFELGQRYSAEIKQLFTNWAHVYMEETNSTLEKVIPEISSSIDSVDEESKDAVIIATVHSTKGLEYKHVICAGFTYRTAQQAAQNIEELNIFYVQVSRAIESCLLVHSDWIKLADGDEKEGYKNAWLVKLILSLREYN